jgi:hypothetical protein
MTIHELKVHLATKADLKRFATKDDLKNFATKNDLKGFATKADVARLEERVVACTGRFSRCCGITVASCTITRREVPTWSTPVDPAEVDLPSAVQLY